MQSLFCMLSRVIQWSDRIQLRNQPPDVPCATDLQIDNLPCKARLAPTCRTAPLVAAAKGPLRVKLHRDNLRDCTPFPARLVISGRMADVHAELERLAAMEAMT